MRDPGNEVAPHSWPFSLPSPKLGSRVLGSVNSLNIMVPPVDQYQDGCEVLTNIIFWLVASMLHKWIPINIYFFEENLRNGSRNRQ